MRRLLMVVALGVIVCLLGHEAQAMKKLSQLGVSPKSTTAQWTIMVYMVADNNLEGAAIDDMNEMELVGSSEDVNIVVQVDRHPGYDVSDGDWTTTRRYLIEYDQYESDSINSPYTDIGEINMGDPFELTDFVEWSRYYYPAERYFLVIWNHGGGWLRVPPEGLTATNLAEGSYSSVVGEFGHSDGTSVMSHSLPPVPFGSTGFKDIGPDETDGDRLFNFEIRNALLASPKLDIIGFDACLMGMIEVGFELRDCAQYMIASEEEEPWDGWPYDWFLSYLAAEPSYSPAQLCSLVVLTYADYWSVKPWAKDEYGQTLSAIDLGDIRQVSAQTDSMVNAIIDGNSWPDVMSARPQAENFLPSKYCDLYDIADLLSVSVTDPTIVNAANSLKGALSDAIIINRAEARHQYAHGLSIYFPQELYAFDFHYTLTPSFADSSNWITFLSYYFGDGEFIFDLPEPNDFYTQAGLPLNPEIAYPSYISSLADQDWWLINSGMAESITITLDNPPDADLNMSLYESDGTTLIDSSVTHGLGLPDSIFFSTEGAGNFYVSVKGDNSFSTSPYEINVEQVGHNSGWFRLSHDDNAPDGGYFTYIGGDVIGSSFSLAEYPMILDRVWINFTGIAGAGSGNGQFQLLLYDNYGFIVHPDSIGPLVPPDTGWAYLDLTGLEPMIYTDLFVGIWYDGVNTPVIGYDDHPSGRDRYWNAITHEWTSLDKSLFIRLDVRYLERPTAVFEGSEDSEVPDRFALDQNYPNPFNASTTISFEAQSLGNAQFEVFNILGQRVYAEDITVQSPGRQRITWDAENSSGKALPSGMYFYRVTLDEQSQTKKMVLLK